MPVHQWRTSPRQIAVRYEKHYSDTTLGALGGWAERAAESLHYLNDLDEQIQVHYPQPVLDAGHHADTVDVAHVRWAAGTAITALDLGAAFLGRLYCRNTGPREFDLRDFDPGSKGRNGAQQRRGRLPTPVCNWVDRVLSDDRYIDIHGARNPLTHSWLNQRGHRGGTSVGHAYRSEFHIRDCPTSPTEKYLNARGVVINCTALATEQLTDLFERLDSLLSTSP